MKEAVSLGVQAASRKGWMELFLWNAILRQSLDF